MISQQSGTTIRVVLSEEDFCALVAGRIVTARGVSVASTVIVEMILTDISGSTMHRLIEDIRHD